VGDSIGVTAYTYRASCTNDGNKAKISGIINGIDQEIFSNITLGGYTAAVTKFYAAFSVPGSYSAIFNSISSNAVACSMGDVDENGDWRGYPDGPHCAYQDYNKSYTIPISVTGVKVNGACGTSGGGSFASIPTTNLCASGTASSVSGAGPWSWTCSGANGGSDASCSATKTSTPTTCNLPWGGTLADGGTATAYQSSSVACGSACSSETRTCNSGTLSKSYTYASCSPDCSCVSTGCSSSANYCSGASFYDNCSNYCGEGTKSCPAPTFEFTAAPTSVSSGGSSTISWTKMTNTRDCQFTDPDSGDSWLAKNNVTNLVDNGSIPKNKIKSQKTYLMQCWSADSVWSGIKQATVSINANVDGHCYSGPLCSASSPTAPNLCAAGTATTVTKNGSNWEWTCKGTGTGTTSNCSLLSTGINAACGTFHGQTFNTKPSQTSSGDICSIGGISVIGISGSGPWTWTCYGYCGGNNAECSTKTISTSRTWKEVTP
jgi:hypothetical protein